MKREPSKYQKDILDWVKNGSGNCVVDALAGTGKSTTLEMIAQNLPDKSRMLFLAFNKHIKDELLQKEGLQEILNSNRLKIMTVNSLGNSTVLEYGKTKDGNSTVELCPNKLTKLILDDVIYECMLRENKPPQNYDSIIVGLIKRHAKTCIDLVRSKLLDYKKVTEIDKLIDVEHLFMFPKNILVDFKIPHLDWSWIVSEAIEREIEMFQETGEYDFIDQVYLPVVLNLPLPQWVRWYTDFVCVDESQDLSVLQQRFISKLQYINSYNTTRYIFVGDKRQAIYKFNGADSTSIENIEKYFHTKEFPLNICYRCPVKALDLAREYVPQIESRQNAIEGTVTSINDSEVADLARAGDLIMARKNKDLIKVFLQILKKRKKVYFKKADFLNTILNNIKSRKKIKTMKDLRDFINKEKEKQNELKQEEDSQKSVLDVEDEDVFSTMLSLVQFFEQNAKEMEYPLTIQGFFTFISDIISNEPSKDCITVGSIHSMKGLEANRVFIVNYFEMPYNFGMGEDYFTQEKNLKYIAETRTKNELFLCVNDMDED